MPAGITETGAVKLSGAWDDVKNFSAVLTLGPYLLIGSDEVGFVQVGRRDDGDPDHYKRVDPIPLAQGESDIESLATDGSAVYALGSHSASRKPSSKKEPTNTADENRREMEKPVEHRAERDHLYKFTFDQTTGQTGPPAEASLRAFLDGNPILGPFAALASKENGIDIEGLAADGTSLYAGLRGPVLRRGLVPVVKFRFSEPDKATLLFVALDGRGIRDLDKVSDGFLVLAGPVGDGDHDCAHRLYFWDGKDCVRDQGVQHGTVRLLGEVPSSQQARAEGIAVTRESPDSYELLVVFDGADRAEAKRLTVRK